MIGVQESMKSNMLKQHFDEHWQKHWLKYGIGVALVALFSTVSNCERVKDTYLECKSKFSEVMPTR